jgi:hypothetical protein
MTRNNKRASFISERFAKVNAGAAKCIVAIIAILLIVAVSTFTKKESFANNQVGMASGETDIQDAIIEVTTAMTEYIETVTEETTSTTVIEETETITTEVTISITLDDVDSQPWVRPIGAKYQVSKGDFVQLCNLIGREYGADYIPVQEKAAVVQTVMNRVMSPSFPNTVQGVIEQPGQYEGFLSRGYYSDKVTESVRLAVLGCLNGEFTSRYTVTSMYAFYGECDIDEYALFYWGDGYFNHFYQTYEEFKVSYDYFLNNKDVVHENSRKVYLYMTGQQ